MSLEFQRSLLVELLDVVGFEKGGNLGFFAVAGDVSARLTSCCALLASEEDTWPLLDLVVKRRSSQTNGPSLVATAMMIVANPDWARNVRAIRRLASLDTVRYRLPTQL